MDFDNENEGRGGPGAADPVPPDDWDGFRRLARTEAILAEQRPRLAGFFRRNAHPQDVADLVQESFRRFFTAKGYFSIGDKPGAYLAQTARTLLKERARTARAASRRRITASRRRMSPVPIRTMRWKRATCCGAPKRPWRTSIPPHRMDSLCIASKISAMLKSLESKA